MTPNWIYTVINDGMMVFRSVTVQVKAKHGAIWKMVSRMIKTKVPGPVKKVHAESEKKKYKGQDVEPSKKSTMN